MQDLQAFLAVNDMRLAALHKGRARLGPYPFYAQARGILAQLEEAAGAAAAPSALARFR